MSDKYDKNTQANFEILRAQFAIEIPRMIETSETLLPYLNKIAAIKKAKYDALIESGFSKEDAQSIISKEGWIQI